MEDKLRLSTKIRVTSHEDPDLIGKVCTIVGNRDVSIGYVAVPEARMPRIFYTVQNGQFEVTWQPGRRHAEVEF